MEPTICKKSPKTTVAHTVPPKKIRPPQTYPMPTLPPSDTLKGVVSDTAKQHYPANLKGHYLTRPPFDNSVKPSYNLKSKHWGLNQNMMDVPKL